MRVLMTGATGFIGRALTLRLTQDDHVVVASVRDPKRAALQTRGAEVQLVDARDGADVDTALGRCDAVVNLAGAPVLGGRWTDARRKELVSSRVALTRDLVRGIVTAGTPEVLVSGSAVGFYGDGGDAVLDEASPGGHDFLAELCRDWEAAALAARDHDVRVAIIRTGVVLGPGGGALAQMRTPFQMGVGGRIGSGRQYMPWIHLQDIVELFATALTDPSYDGTFNGTAPEPVTNRDFTRALGKALRRPTLLPVPKAVLKLVFGDAASVLMAGQRALPKRATEAGFTFRFPRIQEALDDAVRSSSEGRS